MQIEIAGEMSGAAAVSGAEYAPGAETVLPVRASQSEVDGNTVEFFTVFLLYIIAEK